jgi:UDP-glucose 4-epimerase
MQVLVTGGAGYVGSVVSAVLLQSGHQVTVLDDLSTGHADAVPAGATFVQGSIAAADPVFAAAEQAGAPIEAVIHFAAKSLVGESVTSPELYWNNNVTGSQALLESMRRFGVGRIVFSSTAAVYGEPQRTPILETDPTQPTNPYGASKLAVDHMLTSYAKAHDLAAVSLRYFNVAGALITDPGTSATAVDLGERHATETHLIPIALQTAAGTRDALQIHGTDYPTADGSCVRDYIHVLDLADAHVRAVVGATAGRHLICNLGSGTGSSVREVIETVRSVTGKATPALDAPRRAGDPAVLIASNELAATELGWRPVRGLESMVTDAWTFVQRRS